MGPPNNLVLSQVQADGTGLSERNIALSGPATDLTTLLAAMGITQAILNSQQITISYITQTAHGFTLLQPIREGATGYEKAQANSRTNAQAVGVVLPVDTNHFFLVYNGFIPQATVASAGLTATTKYFLSASTLGAYTSTPPVGLTEFYVPLFGTDDDGNVNVKVGPADSLAPIALVDLPDIPLTKIEAQNPGVIGRSAASGGGTPTLINWAAVLTQIFGTQPDTGVGYVVAVKSLSGGYPNEFELIPAASGGGGGGTLAPYPIPGDTIDLTQLDTGQTATKTISGAWSPTFSGVASKNGLQFYLAVTSTGTTPITWSGVTWDDAVAPTQENNRRTIYTFLVIGGIIHGKLWGQDFVTDTTPPTPTSIVLSSDYTWTVNFSEPVQYGVGGNGGFTVTASGGGVTLTPFGPTGTNQLLFSGSRNPSNSETLTMSYTQPGSGVEDIQGNDLASFTNTAVTNNAPVAYDMMEGFETAQNPNPNFAWEVGSGAVGGATPALVGIGSLLLTSSISTSRLSHVITVTGTDHIFYRIKIMSAALTWGPWIRTTSGNQVMARLEFNADGSGTLRAGNGSIAIAASAFPGGAGWITNTEYFVWLDHTDNGVNGTATVRIALTGTKPGSHTATYTNNNAGLNATSIAIQSNSTADVYIDQVIHNKAVIGDIS